VSQNQNQRVGVSRVKSSQYYLRVLVENGWENEWAAIANCLPCQVYRYPGNNFGTKRGSASARRGWGDYKVRGMIRFQSQRWNRLRDNGAVLCHVLDIHKNSCKLQHLPPPFVFLRFPPNPIRHPTSRIFFYTVSFNLMALYVSV
jgi:hypothetical protein